MEELIFTGVDVRKYVDYMLENTEPRIKKEMTDDEKKVFDYTIDFVLSLLERLSTDELVILASGDNVKFNSNDVPLEEFTLDDLLKLKGLKYTFETIDDKDRVMVY